MVRTRCLKRTYGKSDEHSQGNITRFERLLYKDAMLPIDKPDRGKEAKGEMKHRLMIVEILHELNTSSIQRHEKQIDDDTCESVAGNRASSGKAGCKPRRPSLLLWFSIHYLPNVINHRFVSAANEEAGTFACCGKFVVARIQEYDFAVDG